MRVDLPGGEWADLIEVDDLRSADLKAYRRAMPVGPELTMGVLDDMKDVLLRRLITNWSLPLPLPKELPGTEEEPGSLDRITIGQYQALVDALEAYLEVFNAEPDPKPSSGSAGTSADSPSTSESSSPTS